MSVIEEALVSILIAAATTAGARIYPLVLPSNPTLPAVSYNRVSTPRVHSLSGYSHLSKPRIQFTAWALTYAAAKVLANEVRAALDVYVGTILGVAIQSAFADNELDMFEPRSKLYHVPVDYIVAHYE